MREAVRRAAVEIDLEVHLGGAELRDHGIELFHRGDRVFGGALLWGNRLEGELGWRAATAYPLALYVPATLDDAETIAEGLSVYGVRVEIAGAPAPVHEAVPA